MTPPMTLNIVVPPTSINIVTPPVVSSSPTNINPPPPIPTNTVPLVQNIPLQTLPQMPPLGPAPTQLPPLVHPPPSVPLQSVINPNATILETNIPVQTQFETLNLNQPLEPISSIVNDSTQINNELNTTQKLVDGNSILSPSIDTNETINPNGESSLVAEQDKIGMYS